MVRVAVSHEAQSEITAGLHPFVYASADRLFSEILICVRCDRTRSYVYPRKSLCSSNQDSGFFTPETCASFKSYRTLATMYLPFGETSTARQKPHRMRTINQNMNDGTVSRWNRAPLSLASRGAFENIHLIKHASVPRAGELLKAEELCGNPVGLLELPWILEQRRPPNSAP